MQLDVTSIYTRARAAGASLKPLSVKERLIPITCLKKLILNEREAIIDRIQSETSKCRTDALMSEIFPVLDHLAYLEKFAAKILSDRKTHTPLALMGKNSQVYFEPLGVVLVISPWNYPFYQAVAPCVSAYVAGNAAVYKPSEHTPLQGLVEDLVARAGFATSSIQIVYGDAAVGEALIAARPDKIFFTGSTRTGKKIMAKAAENLTPVELELGGKDPMIVFEDANLTRAAAGAAWGALTNCGQACTSVERLYVHASIYEPFKKALLREIERIKQGVDADGNSDIGLMTVGFQAQVIKSQIDDAKKHGAIVTTGGTWSGDAKIIPPMIIENATAQMSLVQDESFGPLIPLIKFSTEDEVIRLANDSQYGLAASVWSADLSRADRVARALVTGNVSINNVMLTEGNHALPFGGVKNSGFGRRKGEFGLYAFSNVKSVLIDKNSRKIEANWYPYTTIKYKLFTSMMIGLFSKGIIGFLKFAVSGLRLEMYSAKASKHGRHAD